MSRNGTANGRPPEEPKPTFFSGRRRKLTIVNCHFKRNAENEQRMLIEFEMPLTGQPIDGYPQFIADAFEAVNKENSACTEAQMKKTEVEGIGLEFFDVESSKGALESLSAATLRNFKLLRRPEASSFIVALTFNTTVPRTKGLVQFLHTYYGMVVSAKFNDTQMKIQYVEPKQMSLDDEDDAEAGGDGESSLSRAKEHRA